MEITTFMVSLAIKKPIIIIKKNVENCIAKKEIIFLLMSMGHQERSMEQLYWNTMYVKIKI